MRLRVNWLTFIRPKKPFIKQDEETFFFFARNLSILFNNLFYYNEDGVA